MFDPELIPAAGDRARILAVSPLIREMMLYALRWPIYRGGGDDTSDAFFRTLADLVAEALDHEAPLSLPSSHDPVVAAAMAYTKEHLQSVTLAEVCRAVAVSERTLRRQFQSEAGISWRTYFITRQDAPGDGPAGRSPADGSTDRDGGRLRQRRLIHPGLQSVLRGNPVVIPTTRHLHQSLIRPCVRASADATTTTRGAPRTPATTGVAKGPIVIAVSVSPLHCASRQTPAAAPHGPMWWLSPEVRCLSRILVGARDRRDQHA